MLHLMMQARRCRNVTCAGQVNCSTRCMPTGEGEKRAKVEHPLCLSIYNGEMCLPIYNGALCLQSSGSRSAEMAGLARLE
jgi:hypothetical protein